jgi:hypothetical protein
MSEIAGIEIYPIISLLIFVLFFTYMIWRTMKINKKDIANFSNIPLDEDEKYIVNNDFNEKS